MRIVVFGAAGRTGRFVVERALGHGHEVTAFVHRTPLQMTHTHLTIAEGDVREFEDVSSAIEGRQAVAFALSQGSGGGGDIHEAGIANVVHAMALHDVRRLAAISAAGVFARGDHKLSIGYRTLIATTLRSVYNDLEAMEKRIMASDLDWTIVRPVGLSNEPAAGEYRVSLDGSLLSRTARISREDVAAFVLKSLETDTYLRRAVVIAE